VSPLKVAVVGGECTGKTVLCQQLADKLPAIWVPEYLREFVERRGRPPLAQEQQSILAAQIEKEAVARNTAAAAALRWVACDSAPVATAIYSEMYFGDSGLYERAIQHHATYAFTLLMDTDLAWEPDGLQRDGPVVRAEFHSRIETWLRTRGVRYALIGGDGDARSTAAISALRAVESQAR
jgi:nicotinamide riboside kinase